MTLEEIKAREDAFIEEMKSDGRPMTFEYEMTLRYGYGVAAREFSDLAFVEGVEAQMDHVLGALGAARSKRRVIP